MTTDITPIRTLRHHTVSHMAESVALLIGEPGLSKDEQIARIDAVIEHLTKAREHMVEAKGILVARDEQAHAEEKDKVIKSFLN